MFKKLTLSLCLPLFLATTAAMAAPAVSDPVALMQSVLSQERAWAGLESKSVTAEGINFAYSEGGPKNAPTVLLVHGFSGSRDNWNRIARKLTKKWHVVALDLPGHGDTKAPADYDYTVANLADSLRKFVLALKIEKNLHVAGHSLGGGISVLYSSLYFLEVKSLLLVDTAGIYANAGNSLISKPAELGNMVARKPGDFERIVTQVATYDTPFIPKELMQGYETLHLRHVPEQEKLMKTMQDSMKLMTPDTFRIGLRSVEAPTLVIWGDKDAIIGVQAVDEIKQSLKNGEYLILKDVGHTPILEADYPVSEAYLNFLDKTQAMPSKFAPAATSAAK